MERVKGARWNAGADSRALDRLFAGGLAWSAGGKAVTQLLSWASVLIAARLLSPADFGLATMAGVFFVVTNVLAEFGIGSAVLQMQELERDVLGQIHAFACLLCAVIFLAGEAAAPLIAAFFKSERLLPVLLVNNLTFLITGFQQVPSAILQREMDYRRISISEAAVAFAQAVTTIGAAIAGLGYWSLVIGAVSGRTSGAILNYYWQPVPFRAPHWREIRAAVRMGGQIAIARLAWSAYTQSDGIVVGRTLGDSVLGTYQMAMTLASAPAEKISTLIMRAAGPLFARIQKDPALVRRYFLIILEGIGLTVFPLMMGLALVAPDAVEAVLGKKWAAAAAPLSWLALFVTLRSIAALADQVLVSLRRTGFTMGMSLLNLVVMPVAFLIASRWGVEAVAVCWLVLAPMTILPVLLKLAHAADLKFHELTAALTPALVGSCALLVATAFVRQWLSSSAFIRLIAEMCSGGAVYLLVLGTVFRSRIARYIRFLRSLRQGGL